MTPARLLGLALLVVGTTALGDSPVDPGKPLSPEEGLKSIRVKEGFAVELVAAEPLIADPVAIAWGPDGKLWVVEMADYPVGSPKGSRVRYLEDTDNDGKYDKSTVFIDGVKFPNGILPWRKGVIVTAAPDIFYAEDSDGDGKADKKEVLYTGFTEGNPQLRINGLRWGLDNWVYLANGWSSRGKVKSVKTGKEIEVSGRDLRIRPDTGEMEAVEGMTEFGRERDDFGDWFGCDNAHPMWHFVLPERYTSRNPHVSPPDPREQLLKPFPPMVYAISKRARRYNAFDIQDHFQSACSAVVYRDELLFAREDGKRQAFVCDPVHNLVHHTILTESGVTFTAARAPDEQSSEFFASTDNWCRPVMALTGPDGALWVVDMYRFMVEHPEYLPEVGKKELSPHYRLGEDRGRIYRVVKKGERARPRRRLDGLDAAGLVRTLESPNGWERDTAQMMLLWRADRASIEPLKRLVRDNRNERNPLARLHALCVLDGLGELDEKIHREAFADWNWAVRRQAVRLAERPAAQRLSLLGPVATEAFHQSGKVRLQVAFTLGQWDDEGAGTELGRLAIRDRADPYMAAAVLSSAGKHYDAIVAAMTNTDEMEPAGPLYRGLLRMMLTREVDGRSLFLLVSVLGPTTKGYSAGQMELVGDWLDTMASQGFSFDAWCAKLGPEMAESLGDSMRRLALEASTVVADASAPAEYRVAAAGLLGRRPESAGQDLARLASLLVPQSPAPLQSAAVRAIGRAGGERAPQVLLEKWAEHSPELRGTIVDVLLRNEAWSARLLDAVEMKRISPADIDLPRRQRLLNHKDAAVKARAAKLLAESAVATNRQKVLEAWQPVLSMKGDARRGAEVFRQNCAVCHRLGDVGQEVGPNLEAVREWAGEAVLTAILDPNRQTEPKYIAYTATTNNGETIYGVVASESGNAVTMKGLDGKERAVLRGDLKSLVSSNRTLMPDGFESSATKEQMADLIEFLKVPERGK